MELKILECVGNSKLFRVAREFVKIYSENKIGDNHALRFGNGKTSEVLNRQKERITTTWAGNITLNTSFFKVIFKMHMYP